MNSVSLIRRRAWLVLLITLTTAARLGADTVDTNPDPAGEMESEAGHTAGSVKPDTMLPAVGSIFRDRLRSGGEGPEMVVIPAGQFRMGCVSGIDCINDEKPVREVVIARPFAMSKYEVTFDDYDRYTYLNKANDEGWGRGRRPVINVSWEDAMEYAAWLSTETGKRYRLPTEAEWEYAARAGSISKYHFGNNKAQLCQYANHADTSTDLDLRNKACSDGVSNRTAEVGQFQPNEFGLYDMHGNVWEWVQDCGNENYVGAPTDSSAWTSGDCSQRGFRGGSWATVPWNLRTAYRGGGSHTFRHYSWGFRLVQDL